MEVKNKYQQTEIGFIPQDWHYDLLDANCKRGSGHTPNKKIKEYYSGDIIWVSLADSDRLDQGVITSSAIRISEKGIANSSAILHQKGVVLMSRDAGVGKSAVAGCDLSVSQHFITWFCNEKSLHNWYLYYWLQYQKKQFERIAMGSTIKTIGLPFFKRYRIPIPKYPEQITIATALSDTDALINSLEKLIAKKRNIKQGAMQELLKPKKGWEEKKLGDNASLKARIGWQGLTTSEYRTTGDYFLITGTEFTKGIINWDKCFYVDKERFAQDKNIQVCQHDVLVTKDGTIGKVALIKSLPKPATLNSGVFVIRPVNESFDPDFFYYLLLSDLFSKFLTQLTAGSTINHLYQKDFVTFKFLTPKTIKEQQEIAKTLSDIDDEIIALESKLQKYRQIKTGMMQTLLTGQIRLV